MIQCEGLSKSYRGRVVVDSFAVTIEGGIFGLLGPNGAGKSTLLKMMTGLERPDAGSVRIAGLDVWQDAERVKQTIGVLPDQLGLFEPLTLLENLECVGPVYGLSGADTRVRARGLLELLDLGGVETTVASEGSFGMRKKTALAMALLHNPRVVFLDEPFEGVDPASSRAIERMLVELSGRGVTVVLTSHVLGLLERVCGRVMLLERGRVRWDSASGARLGTLEELYFELVGDTAKETPAWLGY